MTLARSRLMVMHPLGVLPLPTFLSRFILHRAAPSVILLFRLVRISSRIVL